MIRKIARVGTTSIEYFVHGLAPKLLIHAGIHGDEAETGAVVARFIKKNLDNMPDFVFVPKVSPSAVKAKTRVNKSGKDMNRTFFDTATEAETRANIDIVTGFHFDLLVSFHEDVEFSQFYMYDSIDRMDSTQWQGLQRSVKKAGVSLLNGVDDPSDPVLNYNFVDGYCYCLKSEDSILDGTFEDWAHSKGIIKHWIMPEVPSTIKASIKERLVASVFKHIVFPSFVKQEEEVIAVESSEIYQEAVAL